MIIRKATPADSPALIALTAASPMKGKISIRTDRQPDFFSLLAERGAYSVFVAEDEKHQIIGSFSACLEMLTINGLLKSAYYLGDLKVASAYQRSSVAYRLVKAMQKEVEALGAEILICTAAEGNNKVFPFFMERAGLPAFSKTTFNVWQLLSKNGYPDKDITTEADTFTLERFYRSAFQHYKCFPAEIKLKGCTHFSISANEKIVAAISLIDPSAFKQNVIIDYPFTIGIALGFLRTMKTLLRLPDLPMKGKKLHMLYVKYAAYEKGHEKSLLQIINATRALAYKEQYHFVTIAADEKDVAINKLIAPLSSFCFRSVRLMTSLSGNHGEIEKICNGLCYEDYSLV